MIFLLKGSPEITKHPQSVTKIEGDDVTLSCNASDNPEPEISWEKDGSTVTGNDRIRLSDYKKRLTITSLMREGNRNYQGVATNSVSVISSGCATLNVQCKY